MVNKKFCKDCEFYRPLVIGLFLKGPSNLAKCGHPSLVNPVDGKPNSFCETQRDKFLSSHDHEMCGFSGKLFKEKN